jgi:hypothetical protein
MHVKPALYNQQRLDPDGVFQLGQIGVLLMLAALHTF